MAIPSMEDEQMISKHRTNKEAVANLSLGNNNEPTYVGNLDGKSQEPTGIEPGYNFHECNNNLERRKEGVRKEVRDLLGQLVGMGRGNLTLAGQVLGPVGVLEKHYAQQNKGHHGSPTMAILSMEDEQTISKDRTNKEVVANLSLGNNNEPAYIGNLDRDYQEQRA
ncbi:hypothetical protein Ancab_023275 [Ancistrocladus abbreviatus]